jgi:hypothetical protein
MATATKGAVKACAVQGYAGTLVTAPLTDIVLS